MTPPPSAAGGGVVVPICAPGLPGWTSASVVDPNGRSPSPYEPPSVTHDGQPSSVKPLPSAVMPVGAAAIEPPISTVIVSAKIVRSPVGVVSVAPA